MKTHELKCIRQRTLAKLDTRADVLALLNEVTLLREVLTNLAEMTDDKPLLCVIRTALDGDS